MDIDSWENVCAGRCIVTDLEFEKKPEPVHISISPEDSLRRETLESDEAPTTMPIAKKKPRPKNLTVPMGMHMVDESALKLPQDTSRKEKTKEVEDEIFTLTPSMMAESPKKKASPGEGKKHAKNRTQIGMPALKPIAPPKPPTTEATAPDPESLELDLVLEPDSDPSEGDTVPPEEGELEIGEALREVLDGFDGTPKEAAEPVMLETDEIVAEGEVGEGEVGEEDVGKGDETVQTAEKKSPMLETVVMNAPEASESGDSSSTSD
ncbi:MAG: hypothetical protein PVH19_15590, partial [Planctomycetia bacterium]